MAKRKEIRLMVFVAVRCLVDQPNKVSLKEIEQENSIKLRILVAPNDLGKVIGKNGRIARSLRVVLQAAGKAGKMNFTLDIDARHDLAKDAPLDTTVVGLPHC
jgi:uncharacterized protein